MLFIQANVVYELEELLYVHEQGNLLRTGTEAGVKSAGISNEEQGGMSAADYLGTYAEGWTNGDADKILSAVSEGFVFDDPNAGQTTKNEFAAYLATLKETARSLPGVGG
jgi:hypothetical protein